METRKTGWIPVFGGLKSLVFMLLKQGKNRQTAWHKGFTGVSRQNKNHLPSYQ